MQVVDIDDLGAIAKDVGVFVVRIEQDDVRTRVGGKNGRQDQGDSAGFPGTGGAEHGEMVWPAACPSSVGRGA